MVCANNLERVICYPYISKAWINPSTARSNTIFQRTVFVQGHIHTCVQTCLSSSRVIDSSNNCIDCCICSLFIFIYFSCVCHRTISISIGSNYGRKTHYLAPASLYLQVNPISFTLLYVLNVKLILSPRTP